MKSTVATDPPDTGQPADPHTLKQERAEGKQALKELMRPLQGKIYLAQALAAVAAVLTVVPFWALVAIGNEFMQAGNGPVDSSRVWTLVAILTGAMVVKAALGILAGGITHAVDAELNAAIRDDMVEALSKAPLSWFTATNSGRVRKSLQDDLAQVHMLIAHQPVDGVMASVTPVVLLAYSFIIDWRLGLLTVATLPIYFAFMYWMMHDMGEKTVEMDARLDEVSSQMVQYISGISVVKAFGQVGKAHASYRQAARKFTEMYRNWVGPMLVGSGVSYALISVPVLLAVMLGGGLWLHNMGYVTAPQILAATLICFIIPQAVNSMGGSVWIYQIAGAAALRIKRTLDTPELDYTDNSKTPDGHDIEFDHVSYSFGQNLAVDDVSFHLDEATVTALVGPSGSGKSTIATLVARFDDPDSGTVRLGGTDVSEMAENTLYRHVGFVLQDPQLLDTTIAENIRLAKPEATMDEIVAAAKDANIDHVIQALPHGYDTELGDISLSGGQQQRIAIARALIGDCPVLILDEATAFSDPESEAEIQRALNRLVKGKTVLVIAHRPESVTGADRIIVVDRGRIVANGTPEQVKDNPLYSALFTHARCGDDAAPSRDTTTDGKD
ncbi:ABC transporter ATP-binding protein [Corynebacterium mendelii]|uniref:ABC transporter ATP-binding protein n=1 Tax=Corynebacterium mendelii TaxID=2765362 RepID=A0A939E0N3_9CORY|nr:ABC transporter ATP-binding protein [Corynebacterium mendelii]MBN9644518.1 ABC transporter ATP-binding protein [Corynebacterium mendelii]